MFKFIHPRGVSNVSKGIKTDTIKYLNRTAIYEMFSVDSVIAIMVEKPIKQTEFFRQGEIYWYFIFIRLPWPLP